MMTGIRPEVLRVGQLVLMWYMLLSVAPDSEKFLPMVPSKMYRGFEIHDAFTAVDTESEHACKDHTAAHMESRPATDRSIPALKTYHRER